MRCFAIVPTPVGRLAAAGGRHVINHRFRGEFPDRLCHFEVRCLQVSIRLRGRTVVETLHIDLFFLV